MAYATQQMLTDRVGEPMLILLTDRAAVPTGLVDAETLARAQADADAMIDGYLAGRYTLPLSGVPALVADIAQAVTLWKLHTSEPEAKIKADYEDALKRLRDIAQGVIRLVDVAGVQSPSSGAEGVQITDRDRPFTEANMKGFI